DASPIWRRFPGLRAVGLADGGGLAVGAMDLPELRELSVTGRRPLLERWPALEVLRLKYADPGALASVLHGRNLPSLRVLALSGGSADAFLTALPEAPILDRLEELDLSGSSPVGPSGVAAIRSALERFRRIPRRALRIGEETDDPLLRELCNHVP